MNFRCDSPDCENEETIDLDIAIPYRFEEGCGRKHLILCKECLGNGKLVEIYEELMRNRD